MIIRKIILNIKLIIKKIVDWIYIPNIYQMSELERDKRIFDLENEYEEKTFRKFDKVGGQRTFCYEC